MSWNLAYIGQEAAFARGEAPDSGAGPDRREWVVWWLGRTLQSDHPLRPPAGVYGARFAVRPPLSSVLGGHRITPPRTHPPIPRPVPYPVPYPPDARTAVPVGATLTPVYGRL